MRAAIIHAPGDIRVENRPDPVVTTPTDAVIRMVATCVCGSDLWHYRGINKVKGPAPIGHEYMGVVEAVGDSVTTVSPGDLVIGSFISSDGTCGICTDGYQSACVERSFVTGAQAEKLLVSHADGTLVTVPGRPDKSLYPSLLACSDVLGTGWFGAVAAEVGAGKSVCVVGDGAVGLCAVLAASQLGAEKIIAMSGHSDRQKLARRFGATDIVDARGDEGAAAVKDLTGGLGAHSVVECVGTGESMKQSLASCRPGGHVGYVGVPHGIELTGKDLFGPMLHLHGGPAPVRRFLPDLIDRVISKTIEPGLVFTDTFTLETIADAYRAMDERRAIKAFISFD
ncbi:zinc-dependent alcohol dehydrogenase family protein [Corynebacterium mendelii]|uniref:Zinc-dependent alcohol dehydrogenase family protein n=1 Tax=Corynebacterium mendelii TaxID=2765362 RepID=A0A939E3F6_9CORY|nr:zinc-dependent alcohol dehydrogenase family protein [Corynebacterium mendelii]MBN9644862.1 zinc-dependent alcohol dehydrogenase family protein [Corynebacterium mendelii]